MSDTVHYYANRADIPAGTLVELFLDSVRRHGSLNAYTAPDGAFMTRTQVADAVRRGAGALRAAGLERGYRAAILAPNRAEWALADWSCLAAGVVDVPIYSTLPANQVAYILQDSGASLIFVSDAAQRDKAQAAATEAGLEIPIVVFDAAAATGGASAWQDFLVTGDALAAEDFEQMARKAGPDDLATLIYTSGTTGAPKGVMLTHNNIASNIRATAGLLRLGDTDSTISFLPLSHSFQRMVDYLLFVSGSHIAHGAIESVAADMKRLRPTVMVSVPRLYEKVYQAVLDADGLRGRLVAWAVSVSRRTAKCLEEGTALPPGLRWQRAVADRLVFSKLRARMGGRLRFFVSGGAALSPEINRFFLGAGITILEGYGLSETSPVTNVNTLDDFRIGTVGRPVPGTEIRIDDDGEILIRGPQVMKGYYGLDEKTRATITDDGWLRTGDIGELSRDGFLAITDRKKDLIKTSGGKYVAPQAIENLLKKSSFVDQAVVIGEGRKFCAVLVVPAFERLEGWAREQGLDPSDRGALLSDERCQDLLQSEIKAVMHGLASFETPKKIGLIVEEFTVENGILTPTQKVRRAAVAERYDALIESFYRADMVERTVFVAA